MLKPSGFLRNRVDEREVVWVVNLASLCGVIAYVPFGFIYPLILGPQTVDPLWERLALAFFSAFGFLLPRFPQTRPWMQAFVYLLCFLFTGHLFFLVCRNDLNMAYQMGYICTIAVIAFYLDTNFIFVLYVLFNYLLLGISLFYKISYDNLFFGMIITTVLALEWIGLLSRLRIMKSLEESRAAIQEKNQKIQSILENIQQGVLTVESANGIIGSEYSAYLNRLMDVQNPGAVRYLRDILERTQLSKDQMEQVLSSVFCMIGENEFAFALNYHQLPRTLVEGEGPTARHLEFDWNPIYDKQGLVSQLLVCIRDVTELHNLRENAAHGLQELALLGELVNVPRDQRNAVLEASGDLLARLPAARDTSMVQAMRLLHTLKGNARSFGLVTLAEAVHECEGALQEGGKLGSDLLEPLDRLLQRYREIAEHKLGYWGRRDEDVCLPRSRLKAAASVLEHLPAEERPRFQAVYDLVREGLHLTFEQILAHHLKALPQLAMDLKKAPPIVHIVDPGLHFQQENVELLANIFLHLFRNSLDHGLESPVERKKSGKPDVGHISIVLKRHAQGLEILFQDDGRGLNLSSIHQKALRLGLVTADRKLSAEQIADFIFHAGFSTKDQASQISGRGVGLDVVRSMLEDAGGHIHLWLDEVQPSGHASFSFVLNLPARTLTQWGSLSA